MHMVLHLATATMPETDSCMQIQLAGTRGGCHFTWCYTMTTAAVCAILVAMGCRAANSTNLQISGNFILPRSASFNNIAGIWLAHTSSQLDIRALSLA